MSKQNIPLSKLPDIFHSFDGKGHRYLYCETRTEPSINKKHRDSKLTLSEVFGADVVSIVKESEQVFSMGANYENMVNNKLEREGYEKNFEAAKLPWGQWVNDSKILIEHKGEYYFRLYQQTANALTASCKEVTFFKVMKDGSEIGMTKEELNVLKGFLPPEKEKKTLAEGSFDEAKPIVNCFKCKSIVGFRYDGVEYSVKG